MKAYIKDRVRLYRPVIEGEVQGGPKVVAKVICYGYWLIKVKKIFKFKVNFGNIDHINIYIICIPRLEIK